MRAGEQDEVLDFLTSGVLGLPTERVDTHGAVVLLSGERAWKLKRAVRFSFMDFSTLARREAALRAELRLNLRTAPMLYRRVVAVTREQDGTLAVAGSGTPVEWLLEMTRFPADAQLDRVATRGELTLSMVQELARTVLRFHETAEIRNDRGGLAAMREVVEGNEGDLLELVPKALLQGDVEALASATRRELETQAELLEARRAAGRVRHCHGDLHLANIVLLEGQPVLFDCIEFDEAIACTDVLYDVAFLVMDLIQRELPLPAWAFLQAYGELARDDAGLGLLPLFISVRAAIRAKVAGMSAAVLENAEQAARIEAARSYLKLAAHALAPSSPRLLVIAGRSGTGKSSVARELAPGLGAMPGAFLLRTDVIRKRLFGREPTERLPATAYAPEISARVFDELADRARVLLRAGRTVIADGVYGEPEQRRRIERVAVELGVPWRAVWLEAERTVLESRVSGRTGDASDADLIVVRRQAVGIDEAEVGWPRVAADRPLATVAAEVRRVWES
jgi:aminoglycoside phosphotransferase family enzyme/predicted kinase